MCGCFSYAPTPPTGDLARNPGICPDWESNWRPFGSQAGTQSTEPHQPGQEALFKCHSQPHPLEKIPFNTLVHSVLDAVCVFLNTELI